MALRSQQFQIQILTAETVYRKDRRMFLQGNQNGADETQFWDIARISLSGNFSTQ
jgi:hypothetical protein